MLIELNNARRQSVILQLPGSNLGLALRIFERADSGRSL